MDSKEQFSQVHQALKNLQIEIQDGEITREQIASRLESVEISFKNLIDKKKEEEEEKEAKKEREKRPRLRIKNITQSMKDVDTSQTQFKSDADASLDEIRFKLMLYTSIVSFAFGLQVKIDAERLGFLYFLIAVMLLGTVALCYKAGISLWRAIVDLDNLYSRQDMVFERGRDLITEFNPIKAQFGDELLEEFTEFKVLNATRKRVRKLCWSYAVNYLFFSVFAVSVPVFLILNLEAISKITQKCPSSS